MFDRREKTWIERAGFLDRKTINSLKSGVKMWVVMNLLTGNLGRIIAIRNLRNRAVKAGMRRVGSVIESVMDSRLLRRSQPGAMNQALAVCAALGAGAGLMYLFDPDRGAGRRATLRDGVNHWLNNGGLLMGAASRDITNRARGLVARAGSIFRSGATDDETLVARVRSRMGRVVSHPRAIDVVAQDGHVTLSGAILAREVDDLLSSVRSVPGVRGLDNRLDVHNTADIPDLQGGRERSGERLEIMQSNWTPAVRLLGVMAGGALLGAGLRRRGALGLAMGTFGAGLTARGVTNIEMKRLVGLGGGRRAVDFQKTININAPLERVFDFWKNPGDFPHFMTNVREVRDLGGGRWQWTVAGPAGVPVKWNATITRFIPNELIAWKSEPGSAIANAGVIQFERGDNGGTRVTVRMSYNPPVGAIGHVVATIFGANPKREMDEDLLRMKTMIETGHPPRDAAQPVEDTFRDAGPTRGEIIH